MIPHIPLRNFVVRTAEENIPYQVEVMAGGGTDAGKIHVYRQGVSFHSNWHSRSLYHDHVGIAIWMIIGMQ
jgi:endoglucanase